AVDLAAAVAMHILNKTNIDFMRWRWHAVAVSWIVILAGLALIATKGPPRGIEFAGWTSVIMKFDHDVTDDTVRTALNQPLTARGLSATVLSLAGLLAYIAFRYQLSFAVGAVVATIHDLLVVLAFLAFFRYDLTLNVIAAILTVTGYSTNDTIVIFDRVRENLRGMRRDSMNHIINTSINQTLTRTVITSGTALLTALALFFFGGE